MLNKQLKKMPCKSLESHR